MTTIKKLQQHVAAYLCHNPTTLSDHVLFVPSVIGKLCLSVLHDSSPTDVTSVLADLLWNLFLLAELSGLDLQTIILKKMVLNNIKYPLDLVNGSVEKYTAYTELTGVTKYNQSTRDIVVDESDLSVNEMMEMIHLFGFCRGWFWSHTERNLANSIFREYGELVEIIQFASDDVSFDSVDSLDKFCQEIADVSIYLLRLADVYLIYNLGEKVAEIAASAQVV